MKLLMISARRCRTNPQISICSDPVPCNNLILKSETIHRATGNGEGRRLFLFNGNKSQHDLIWRDLFLGSRLQGQQGWGWMTAPEGTLAKLNFNWEDAACLTSECTALCQALRIWRWIRCPHNLPGAPRMCKPQEKGRASYMQFPPACG